MVGTLLAFSLMGMMQLSAALFRAEKWRAACPCFMVTGVIIGIAVGIAVGHNLTQQGVMP